MPPGKRIDYSFLGETAIRLARLLRVGGLISPQFDSGEKLVPTVQVGDATGIGYRGQALRQFAYGENVPAAAANTSKLAIRAPLEGNGIIIDGWLATTGTGGTGLIRFSMLDPITMETPPFPIGVKNCLWVERHGTPSERSGILTAAHNTDALAYGLDFAVVTIGANGAPVSWSIPVMLLPGAAVFVSHTVVNVNLAVSFWGRAL